MFSPRREVTFFFLSSLMETSKLRELPVTPVLERQRQENLQVQVHWPASLSEPPGYRLREKPDFKNLESTPTHNLKGTF